VISRDLREYGIDRYGEKPGGGKLIIDWGQANYDFAARGGGNPLDPTQYSAMVLRRK
jgi:hypothetical protein